MRRRRTRSESWYDVAQICRNGHVVNAATKKRPKHNRDYCEECGQPTITECPSCDASIPGEYHVPNVVSLSGSDFEAPDFCGDCGDAYPWMAEQLDAARELAREMEGLDADERDLLEESLDDIVQETPRTELAAKRVKELMAKAKGPGAQALTSILSNIATKAAMGLLF